MQGVRGEIVALAAAVREPCAAVSGRARPVDAAARLRASGATGAAVLRIRGRVDATAATLHAPAVGASRANRDTAGTCGRPERRRSRGASSVAGPENPPAPNPKPPACRSTPVPTWIVRRVGPVRWLLDLPPPAPLVMDGPPSGPARLVTIPWR